MENQPSPRHQYQITQGQNIIRLIHDDFSNALLIQRPVAMNWPDCHGSIGEYYAVSNYHETQRELLSETLNQALASGDSETIFDRIRPFLELFENGDYTVNLQKIPLKSSYFAFDVDNKELPNRNRDFALNFYHWSEGEVYLGTRPESTFNPERIAYYEQQLLQGKRPKALVYTVYLSHHQYGYPHYYILDGHHKLQAYQKLNIAPELVCICGEETKPEMSKEMLLVAIEVLNPKALDHYLENISDENPAALLQPGTEATIDQYLQSQEGMSYSLCRLFHTLYHDGHPAHRQWIDQRIEALKENKNSRRYLYFIEGEGNQQRAIRMPIHNSKDVDTWKAVYLDGAPLPAYMENRLASIHEQQRRDHLAATTPAYTPPPRPAFENQSWFGVRESFLLLGLILAIISAFLRGC